MALSPGPEGFQSCATKPLQTALHFIVVLVLVEAWVASIIAIPRQLPPGINTRGRRGTTPLCQDASQARVFPNPPAGGIPVRPANMLAENIRALVLRYSLWTPGLSPSGIPEPLVQFSPHLFLLLLFANCRLTPQDLHPASTVPPPSPCYGPSLGASAFSLFPLARTGPSPLATEPDFLRNRRVVS